MTTSNLTPDQTTALRALVTYLTDAMTTVGEVDPDQAVHIANCLRTFDPTDSDLVPMFRDALVGLPVVRDDDTPEPGTSEEVNARLNGAVEVTRAQGLVSLARAAGMADDDIPGMMYAVIEGTGYDATNDVHRFARDHFSGDDDFDEFMHEIDHELGNCSDDDPECMWGPEYDG